MINKTTIDKVLDSAQIVDVVSDFVALKRRGANYIACCPFHHEKTPSFSVSPSKGIYKCFGCGKAGNSINFVMEHEQLSYVDAVKYLGKKYGIDVVDKEETQKDVENRLRHESLLAVSEFARDFFVTTLWNSQRGMAIGHSYFKERGFSDEIIKKFQLGWAPEGRSNFSEAARRAGYKVEFIGATGLSIIKEETGELVDRFYERVMFPVHSVSGRVIAFGGRTLRTDKGIAKYINSPETEIYIKSKSLYGIFFAKSAISKFQKCYLVEGYTDVISLHQAGIENVVASSGTSLTTDQIRLIKRFAPQVTVLYDGDSAGIKASIRGIDMLLEEGLQVKVVLFPDGEDPDSYSRKHSPDKVKEFLESSEEDFIAFKTKLLSSEAQKDPIKRAQLISEVVASIAVIPDAISRSVYIEECSQRLNIAESILAQEVRKLRKKRQYGVYSNEQERETIVPEYFPDLNTGDELPSFVTNTYCESAEKELLYYLIKFGESPLYSKGSDETSTITVSQFILAELQNDDLELQNLIYKEIFDEYYQLRGKGNDEIQRHFMNHQKQEVVKIILDLLHNRYNLTVKHFVDALTPEENVLYITVPKTILLYKAKITALAYQNLTMDLAKAQENNDEAQMMNIMKQLQILNHIRNSFSKELQRLTF
ncbi:DNA primase [bioreactor metagenome]|jgi:DNA primase|uniref:DNA primase n=1 Tax=bioreactor metagenome TaxID=1076179 RepID=A0A644YZQ2_9ZZZZ